MADKPILIVEDDPLQAQMIATLLRRKLGVESVTARHGRDALDILAADPNNSIRLVILDLQMPVMDGRETLRILSQKYPSLPAIMLTGSKDINDALEALRLGAIDFIVKPYEAERMVLTVRNALKLSTLSKEVTRLRSAQDARQSFGDVIGYESGLREIVAIGRKAAASDIPVLLVGETGTGKEVFARAIHGESARSGKPFIAVNCGAIPSQLVESTLFGHEKGSFTGATERALGKFREAEGGTIFLDEVGELPLEAQVKLLRVLQQGEVEPVGGAKPVPVNVRILSATNKDLSAQIVKGAFREDLYFRLNVLQVTLPPLRERPEDILLLANHFIERVCAQEGVVVKTLSPEAQKRMLSYRWPGNVRELENALRRAVVISDEAALKPEDFSIFAPGGVSKISPAETSLLSGNSAFTLWLLDEQGQFKTAGAIEREAMDAALAFFENNTTRAAKALGMAKSTFYKKLKE